MNRCGVWMDRALSLLTAAAVITALYFLAVERVVPVLRGEPERVGQGETLTERLDFRVLGSAGSAGGRIGVPGAGPVLLLVFRSTCPACWANLAAWREVTAAADGAAAVLAVALERDESAARAYADRNLGGAIGVAPADPGRLLGALGVEMVPFTALIDGRGKVAFVHVGRLDPSAVKGAKRALAALVGPSNR